MNVPYFFKYAKDKTDEQVEPINKSTMNRICKSIPNPRISFKNSQFGEFDYRMLMSRWDLIGVELNHSIIEDYMELTKNVTININKRDKENSAIIPPVFLRIRAELESKYGSKEIVDNMVVYLFDKKETDFKLSLWQSFGDVIYQNLIENLKHKKPCERCGILIEKTSNKTKYCDKCQKESELEKTRKRVKRHRNSSKM
jgi:hypothetical protein